MTDPRPRAQLTSRQQDAVDAAREMLATHEQGGARAVVETYAAVRAEPKPSLVGDPYPYAYGVARFHIGALVAVIDELAAEPEAGA